jgi:hypothetical protein
MSGLTATISAINQPFLFSVDAARRQKSVLRPTRLSNRLTIYPQP